MKKAVQVEWDSITAIDWARLAIAIDGEGGISIARSKSRVSSAGYTLSDRYFLDVRVCNTDPRLPNWCAETFGGQVYATRFRNGHRVLFTWVVSSGHAEKALHGCLPYFIIKREQAEVAVAFRATFEWIDRRPIGESRPLPTEIQEQRIEHRRQLLRLKGTDYQGKFNSRSADFADTSVH